MRIVVTGLVATYPMGGMSWAYLSYVDGLRRLGHDVIYLEDTGGWFYDPSRQTFTAEIRANLRYLERALRFIGAGDVAWAVRGPDGCLYGMESGRLAKACHGADLFLNLSGSCWLRDEYRRARRTAYVDTDPGYTQAKLSAVGEGGASERDCFSAALVRAHDRFFTFAEHIGAADCGVPRCGLRWMPTRQPLVLDHWPFCFDPGAPRFTTVMSWNSGGRRAGDRRNPLRGEAKRAQSPHRPAEGLRSGARDRAGGRRTANRSTTARMAGPRRARSFADDGGVPPLSATFAR